MVKRMRALDGLFKLCGSCYLLLVLVGCNGNLTTLPSQSSTVTISAMTPASIGLMPNQTQQFAVTVSGATNTAVTWNLVDASGNSHFSGDSTVGTISAAGLYTAPASVAATTTLTLYVGAAADSSISQQSTITLSPAPPPVTVQISPLSASVQTCNASPCSAISTISFSAVLTNAANTAVTWEVNGQPNGSSQFGTITSAGLYSAPSTVPTPAAVTVTAVSVQDSSKSSSATVTVVAAGTVAVSVNPPSVSLKIGTSQAFSATVTSAADTAVTWAVTCSVSSCGTLTLTGVSTATYTAPSSIAAALDVTLTATAVADPTKSASAAITVTAPQPTLTVTFDQSRLPLHAGGGPLPMTAQVANAPSGSTPVFKWAYNLSLFCISSDEEGPGDYDSCGDSDAEPDGPGTFSSTTAAQTSYSPPVFVYTGLDLFTGTSLCPQATSSVPYVNIPVSADLGGGNVLTKNVCIEVLP